LRPITYDGSVSALFQLGTARARQLFDNLVDLRVAS
jgi:hypothetical protein